MNTVEVSNKPNQSDAVADIVSLQNSHGQGIFDFVDNRTGAVAQRKLDAMINNSPRVAAQHMQINNNIPADMAVIQRLTDIRYGNTQNFHYDSPNAVLPGNRMLSQTAFATSMESDLVVNQPVRGSGPTEAVAPTQARADTEQKYGGAWVLGHLLNDDLGGLGIPANLAPITNEENMEHYHVVERRVKNLLYRQPGGGNFDLRGEGYLQYQVNVDIVNPPWNSVRPDVNYRCRVRIQNDQGPGVAMAPDWGPWQDYTVESRHDDAVNVPPVWVSVGQSLRPGALIRVQRVLVGDYPDAMVLAAGAPA